MMTKELDEQYQAVLRDLGERRAHHVKAITELDAMIAGIGRQLQAMGGELPLVVSQSTLAASGQPDADESRKFADMSVRWAILKLLARADQPRTTGEIAKVLETGGVESKGQRFNSIVSAVLSDMKSKKGEVESVEAGCYQLTNQGHEAWQHIEKSSRYLNRHKIDAGA